ESLGKQRTKRPIDQAGGQDFLVGGAAFALHEPAGEFSRGCAALAIIDLEREEIDAFPRIGADHCAEHDGVAISNRHRAVGQLGQCACLQYEGSAADLALNLDGLHCQKFLWASMEGCTSPSSRQQKD